MEKRKKFLFLLLFLGMVSFVHLALVTTTKGLKNNLLENQTSSSEETILGYAWSKWSSWTPCSRTCGGGVSVQKRECAPRSKSNTSSYSVQQGPLLITLLEKTSPHECLGPSQRFHECNTKPCVLGSEKVTRAAQCTAFDARPFRGKFYNWVPYVDGDSPCTLNCRPQGQQFYASLGLVADGTPCTKPGFRAVCVHGTCEQIIGKEAVLAASSTDSKCGHRLVTGLFSRPRLPLGYSHVHTVPRGACQLNVSESTPSENYIALKITNGSYIMNGEFAVSTPGSYEAIGARFQYSRIGMLDVVYAIGPLQEPVDIMILYTRPSSEIKYEYLTDSLSGEPINATNELTEKPLYVNKHNRRHQTSKSYANDELSSDDADTDMGSFSKDEAKGNEDVEDNLLYDKTYTWKIFAFTHCSRTCGGGHQIGKYRCFELSASKHDREVSSVHCTGSPPAPRRRRCGFGPCSPKWKTTAWSTCPQCGPATRTRNVGCVQDHSKGITKISDHKCPAPKPLAKEACEIPDCFIYTAEQKDVIIQAKRKSDAAIDNFESGPIYTVTVNATEDNYSFSAAGGWLYTEWSECVGWCVCGGVQSRGVKCADPAGCPAQREPSSTRECSTKLTCDAYEGQWFTGDWSECSASCAGRQIRGVLCIGGSGRHLKESACKEPKPEQERKCGDISQPAWYFSDWNKCVGNCPQTTGLQRRTVLCSRADDEPALESDCLSLSVKPPAHKVCRSLEICSTTDDNSETTIVSTDMPIESQRVARNEAISTTTTTELAETTQRQIDTKTQDCLDKLSNCALAVQARLCHYKYYLHNCCNSCGGQ